MIKIVLQILLCTLSLRVCWAAHPLVTDDTLTQAHGHWQVEMNSDRYQRRDQRWVQTGAAAIQYGAASNLDLSLGSALLLAPSDGVGDSTVGAKWRFWENGNVSAGLKTELVLPTGNAGKGNGYGRINGGVTLLGSYHTGPWLLLGNLALSSNDYQNVTLRDANRRILWRTSAAALFTFDAQWRLVVDGGVRRNEAQGISVYPAFLLAGVIYSPHQEIDFDLGAKVGLNKAEVKCQLGAGIALRY